MEDNPFLPPSLLKILRKGVLLLDKIKFLTSSLFFIMAHRLLFW
jgi:hypothetical protein